MQRTEIGSDLIFLALLNAGGRVIRVLEDFNVTSEYVSAEIAKLPNFGAMLLVSAQFSDSAKQVIQKAKEEAAELGHDSFDARHIMLGFTYEQDGVVWKILRDRNVDISALRAAVLALFEETK